MVETLFIRRVGFNFSRTTQFRRLMDVLEQEERVKFMTPALFILNVMH